MARRFLLLVTLVVICGWLTACGYRFTSAADSLGEEVRRVYIAPFENRTAEAYLENLFREAFAERFSRGGRFQMVDSRAEADVVLKGTVRSLYTQALSYRKESLAAAEERATVTLEISLEKRDGKTVWHSDGFPGREDYQVDADPNRTRINRKNALSKLAVDTAERAFDLMMSGF